MVKALDSKDVWRTLHRGEETMLDTLCLGEVEAFFNACLEEDPFQSRINNSTDILCRALNAAMETIAQGREPLARKFTS